MMKNLLTLIVIGFTALSATPSCALKMKPISLQNLSMQADVIALVEIEASRQIKTGEVNCGVEHKTKVFKAIKGDIKHSVNFGYMAGLVTGERYLVFLKKNNIDNKAVIFTSSQFQKQFSDKTTLAICKKNQLAEYTLSQAGTAYFAVEASEFFDFKPAAIISTRYFRAPEGVESVDNKQSPASKWVELDTLLKLIKSYF